MIYDRLEHIGRYRGLGAHLDAAIDFLARVDVASLTGRGEIEGDAVYYMEQNPQLRALQDAKWERHERYIDIQIALAEGEEIYACPMEDVEGWGAFDAQNDCAVSAAGAKGARLLRAAFVYGHLARDFRLKPLEVQRLRLRRRA